METPTDLNSEDDGQSDVVPDVVRDQPRTLSGRTVVSVWLTVGVGALLIWLGLPAVRNALGRIWPGEPTTFFWLAIRGTTRITLVLLAVFAKAVVDYHRRGSKRFLSGTLISWGLWAVVAVLWLSLSFFSAFGDNPQNGFEQELVGPVEGAVAVLLTLGIVLVPSAWGFILDRRSRTRSVSKIPASTHTDCG